MTDVSGRGTDFDEFVLGAASDLKRMAIALTGDRSAAEDVVQDVLERMYVAWPRIDEPLAYARRALINTATNRWRRRRRHREVPLEAAPEPALVDGSEQHGHRDELLRAIAALPRGQRAVVVLRFLHDLSEAETAQTLGCSPGTVKSQSARALARLRTLVVESADSGPTLARRT
jgi:RNA polymerase sigma-70 factor (sigma-E family)